MRKLLIYAITALGILACTERNAPTNSNAKNGALPGTFTINESGRKIQFSQGNLQYMGTWQFAENQWNILGDSQSDNHRDLFGWGTGDTPNKVSTDENDYATFTDWGVNEISNGGNSANQWRTLTADEWHYLFLRRVNAATSFGYGSINGVNGIILLPDNWTLPAGAVFTASTTQGLEKFDYHYQNRNGNPFTHNTYTKKQWTVMESSGAVFLPAAGGRNDHYSINRVTDVDSIGCYWSATIDDYRACYFGFNSTFLSSYCIDNPNSWGLSVRLVKDVE